MYERILVCLDGNMDVDEHVLDHVASLARSLGSQILLLRVAHYHTRDSRTAELADVRDYTKEARDRLEREGAADVRILEASGEPSETIIQVAERNHADLIAMSTHGHGWLYDLLFGSVSDEVRHRTNIPVLLLRQPDRE